MRFQTPLRRVFALGVPISLIVVATIATGSVAGAATCTLELKRLGTAPDGDRQSAVEQHWAYRSIGSQRFYVQMGEGVVRWGGTQAEFAKIVKKEPEKYVCNEPFRGVAKLGSGAFAFVLDSSDKDLKGYDRLYFDVNGNGDLTDDKPIDSVTKDAPQVSGSTTYVSRRFPRVDLTIPVDGKPLEYSFLLSVDWQESKEYSYASASLTAAAYRVGEITVDGARHKVALLDFNSNGRFDEQTHILANSFYAGGGIVAEMGDVFLIDPEIASGADNRGYAYGDEHRQYVSKLARIGDKFCELTISPTGDQLTLTPSTLKIGYITNPNGPYAGMIYGDQGFLAISGEPGKPVAVPEGSWKLFAYAIEITGWKPPAEKNDKSKSLLERLSNALTGSAERDTEPQPRYGPPGVCSVTALGTTSGAAATVRGGETVVLPFGPPYKPVVQARVSRWAAGGQADLSMSLVGLGGEMVSSLVVDGYRPPKPEFTITDAKGEVVQKGDFEYG